MSAARPLLRLEEESTWALAGDVAASVLFDIANRAKDRTDELLDAQRTHGGLTLDDYMAGRT